jgi:hypothetical protein
MIPSGLIALFICSFQERTFQLLQVICTCISIFHILIPIQLPRPAFLQANGPAARQERLSRSVRW